MAMPVVCEKCGVFTKKLVVAGKASIAICEKCGVSTIFLYNPTQKSYNTPK